MSTLNLGQQNVATARESIEPAKNPRMKRVKTLKEIREAAKRGPSLSDDLEASIKTVLDLIGNRFSQLKYSGNLLHIKTPADQDDSEASFLDLFFMFPVEDKAAEQSYASISEGTIATLRVLKDFMTKHCDAKHYSFQIKKRTEKTCIYCSINPVRMSEEVFNSLHFLPYPLLECAKFCV